MEDGKNLPTGQGLDMKQKELILSAICELASSFPGNVEQLDGITKELIKSAKLINEA